MSEYRPSEFTVEASHGRWVIVRKSPREEMTWAFMNDCGLAAEACDLMNRAYALGAEEAAEGIGFNPWPNGEH